MGGNGILGIRGLATIVLGCLSVFPPLVCADDTTGTFQTHSVQFRRLVFKVDPGAAIGTVQVKPDCIYDHELTWQGDQQGRALGPGFDTTFSQELKQDGYQGVYDPDDLFGDSDQGTAEYQVAAVIDSIHLDICYPWVAFQDANSLHGDAMVHVAWQLYSVRDRKVVYQTVTVGTYRNAINVHDPSIPLQKAFADAADQLLKDADFHAILAVKAPARVLAGTASHPTQPITIPELKRFKMVLSKHLDAVRQAVVTIFTPDGVGSGAVISKDGYILTDAHVVGDAASVKVKLVGGEEMTGTVLRSDQKRDVALVKVEGQNMAALPIRASDPEIGDDVYALGASLGTYESTLTKGIVSAYRQDGGNKYIQSDVNVQHGNSGGAMMDADGNLIGLTESGIYISGAPSGVNFFNPILDSLAALDIVIQ